MSDLLTAPHAVASACGVGVRFGARVVLQGVDLDVHRSDLTVIVGPNGAGKTTLLEVLAGVIAPSAGSRSASGAVAFVPQRTHVSDLLPVTVRDVVAMGTWGRRRLPWRADAAARDAISRSLVRLGIADLARHPFSSLSGGQRQRALLAQGLARRADLLLLDEPTTGLDAASAALIRRAMRDEADRGVAVVCVSHDAAVVDVADRVICLADGRLLD